MTRASINFRNDGLPGLRRAGEAWARRRVKPGNDEVSVDGRNKSGHDVE